MVPWLTNPPILGGTAEISGTDIEDEGTTGNSQGFFDKASKRSSELGKISI